MSVAGSSRPMPTYRRMMVFIDGENLVFNYQKLVNNGFSPTKSVNHLQDIFVWHEDSIIKPGHHSIIRTNYYTYATGSDEIIKEITNKIKLLSFRITKESSLPNNIYPIVFKKAKKEAKSKGVDIQMTVDILSHIYMDNIENY